MPQSLWEAWHPDGEGHPTPARSHGPIKAGAGSQGRAAGRNGASPHLLCARPLKGSQVGRAWSNPVSDKLGGPSSPAGDRQGEETTNKGTEAGENSGMFPNYEAQGKGGQTQGRSWTRSSSSSSMLWARGRLWGYGGATGEGRVHQHLATRPPRGKGLPARSVPLPSWDGDGRS